MCSFLWGCKIDYVDFDFLERQVISFCRWDGDGEPYPLPLACPIPRKFLYGVKNTGVGGGRMIQGGGG